MRRKNKVGGITSSHPDPLLEGEGTRDAEGLPEGWAAARLVDTVALLQNGPFGSLLHRSDYVSGGVPLINPANIVEGRVKPDPQITVAPDVIKRLASYVMRPGDVVVARRGEMGRAALVSNERDTWLCGTGCAFLRAGEGVAPLFLAFWFGSPSVRQRLETESVGATMQNLSTRILGHLEIALPPFAEQRRVVEKVEALLARVNAARDRLAKVPAILKRFRQAILAAACSGRLTDDWRGDSTDAPPSEWKRLTVGQVASGEPRSIQSGPFGSNLRHSEFAAFGKLVIGIDNVGDGMFLAGRQNRISDQKFCELAKYTARPGDVLITVMATVGRVCVVPDDIEPAIITKHVYRVTPDRAVIHAEFLACALRGDVDVLERVREQVRGQTRPGINGEILKSLVLLVPPVPEQREIVRRVAALFNLADAIERRVAAATARADKLTQAILAKAFRGELVPTEAELARQEGRDYQRASVLLERIRAIQAELQLSPRPPRRRSRYRSPGESEGTASKAGGGRLRRRRSGTRRSVPLSAQS